MIGLKRNRYRANQKGLCNFGGKAPGMKRNEKGIYIAAVIYLKAVFLKPPGRGPVPGPDINYTGPREVLLEFVILVF